MIDSIVKGETEEEGRSKFACVRQNHIQLWQKDHVHASRWYLDTVAAKSHPVHAKRPKRTALLSVSELHHRMAALPSVTPIVLHSLASAIQESRSILQLQDDWDGEDSPGYSETTWNRTAQFLLENARNMWRLYKLRLEAPRILPGPYGSIDILWQSPKRELLINIPATAEEPASYYGDDKEDGTDNAIRGKRLDTSKNNEWILLWLMK